MDLRWFGCVALLSSAALAQASEPAPETTGSAGQNAPPDAGNPQPFADPSLLFTGQSGAFLGAAVRKIGGEGVYAGLVLNAELDFDQLALGLQAPLNVLVWNDDGCCGPDPAQHTRQAKTYGGLVRRRDWDEPQDFLKFVRFVRYGHKRDPLYVLAGQLWGASIGHGTLVSRYSNSLNLDHTKTGLALDVSTDYFGVETLADHVLDPALLAARAWVRPFGGTPVLRGWAVGLTGALDRTAPRALAYNPDGTLKQDDAGNPIVAVQDDVKAVGIDTEYELVRNSLLSVIPYVDLNRLVGAGNGLHAGVLANLLLPLPLFPLTVQTRLEYRWMKPGYLPEYFDQTYDLGRFQYAVPGSLVCKVPACSAVATAYLPKFGAAQALANPNGAPRKGYYGELALGFAGLLQIGGLLQDYQGDPNGASVGLFATVPKLEVVKLSAYYLRRNMSGLSDTFTIDERSLLAASVAYRIVGPIYFRVDFQRRWQLLPGATQIHAVDSYNAGITAYVSF